ncbi:MAG: heavy-metal-associated domain-containing protein [Rhodospirillales bacterium]
MTCDGCVSAVKRAIRRAAPDAEIQIDLSSGKVEVETLIPSAAVIDAIRAAGFAVNF